MQSKNFDWGMFFFVTILILAFFPWFAMFVDLVWWMLSERHFLSIYEVGNELRKTFYIFYPVVWVLIGIFASWLNL